MSNSRWICCQIGAREHYAIPRALHQTGLLQTLITDAWVPPQSPIRQLPSRVAQSLAERYHSNLSTADIQAFTQCLVSFELKQRLTRVTGWPSILARNAWFQRCTLSVLKKLSKRLDAGDRPVLFSYSYGALDLLRYGKQQGWRTVLGQIDPGIVEEQQVADLQARYGQPYQSSWHPAPASYWQAWRQECELADHIIVNSTWSQTALTKAGIAPEKVAIAPLAYQPPADADTFCRSYPTTFSQKRPLRVLFLGQIILRKGIAALLDALPYLQHQPIEIWLVGPTELTLPPALLNHPQLRWVGPVPRSQVQRYYQQTDVFLFPTHSDGFGLTQLEAQAWKLPIIASQYCGAVVAHQQNGLILPEVSGRAIGEALLMCCKTPESLRQWSQQSVDMASYSLSQLAQTLDAFTYATV